MKDLKKFRSNIFQKINACYFVRLVGGERTSKGSFWAVDESNIRHYIGPNLASGNIENIEQLASSETSFWALVQEITWGGKWKNKKIKEVMVLTQDKKFCEKFKSNLTDHWEKSILILEKKQEAENLDKLIFELRLKIARNEGENFLSIREEQTSEKLLELEINKIETEKKKLEKGTDTLTIQLSDLKSELDIFVGWININFLVRY